MNILLVCNAGMSTGIMCAKLGQEAKNRGIDMEVSAVPLVELKMHLDNVAAILIGPQIRFALNDVKKQADGRPVMTIAPQDFGMMNAKKVMDDLLKLL